MLRIALRVRLRLRSAQDDTKGSEAEDFKKNNPSVTLPRGTLFTKEAKVTLATKSFLATVCHPERSRSLRVVNEQTKVRSTAGIS